MSNYTLIGPFVEIVTMSGLQLKGPITDDQLVIIKDGGILIDDQQIASVGPYDDLLRKVDTLKATIDRIDKPHVLLPGLVDAHTHICFAGSRANDYALRNAGATYLEIAKSGGGIWDTVTKTREATPRELTEHVIRRADVLLKRGITTIEVKSGYGLSVAQELKMLRAIKAANNKTEADIISTCLAAHIVPKDIEGGAKEYLDQIINKVFPILKSENLANRIDAFIEDSAYDSNVIAPYLEAAKDYNFDITIHADQFRVGGTEVAVKYSAISADHLEASTDREIEMIAKSDVIATALPGASIGLGLGFTPARKILDSGGALAIASDWNPGSAPLGDLMTCASILGTFEKLSNAEVLAGITYRAAAALGLHNRGKIESGDIADLIAYPTTNFKEITYHQGQLQPSMIWKNGQKI